MKREKKVIAVLAILLSIVLFLLCNTLKASTYYVDNINGDDSFSGQSPLTAWKSVAKVSLTTFVGGDTILFKADGVWSGQLYPKGSGISNHPVVIDMYGTGNKPLIAGGGTIDYVVNLYNQQYWEINNLEITNQGSDEANRVGVRVAVDNATTIQHIHLKNLKIHEISGRYTFELPGKHTGGVSIRLLGTSANTRLNDLLIEGCEIYNVIRVGLSTHSSYSNANSRLGDQPITNMIVRNNIIHHTAGDGMILRSTYKAVVENNLAYENHSANEGLVSYGVAFWCRSTDTTIFQFNEISQTRGGLDGEAFDSDFDTHGTIFQYNYSHDNEGGFMLIMNGVTGTTIRYNISQNDGAIGKHVFNFSDYDPGGNPNRGIAKIYNNTVYVPTGSQAVIVEHATATSELANNIIYNYGTGAADLASSGQRPVWSYNSFYGTTVLPMDANLLTSDPKVVAPGTAGSGLANVAEYKLRSGSPCLNSGKIISSNGGRDYFNNAVSSSTAPHRGAYNGTAIPSPDVAITSPVNNSHYENFSITMEATATDPSNAVITEVEFFVNGSSIGVDASFPYSISWTIPSAGSYILTAKATNENMLSATSLPVNISAGTLPTCHLTMDDAEEKESTGAVDLNQTDDVRLFFDPWGQIGGQIANQQVVGFRFNNLGIPQGAVIETAYIQFTADEPDPGSGSGSMIIKGEDTDNSLAFTTSTYNISGRANTLASVSWSPAPWTATGASGEAQRTPDLKNIIQEIIDRSGWSDNNNLALIIRGTGDLKRYARSLEGIDPSNAAKLCIVYSMPTLSISNISATMKATLFPNPSSGEVNILVPSYSSQSIELNITDGMGKNFFHRIYEGTGSSIEDRINLNQFSKGIYFVQFRQGDKTHTERLLIME